MMVMPHVSRPLIALLVGTVAFFALWIVALKPQTSGNGSSGKARPLQSAVDKAHAAVAQSNAASVAHGGTVATTPTTPTTPLSPTKPSTVHAAYGRRRRDRVRRRKPVTKRRPPRRTRQPAARRHAARPRQSGSAEVVAALRAHKVARAALLQLPRRR